MGNLVQEYSTLRVISIFFPRILVFFFFIVLFLSIQCFSVFHRFTYFPKKRDIFKKVQKTRENVANCVIGNRQKNRNAMCREKKERG